MAKAEILALAEDDPECTDCGGSGICGQTERRCTCHPPTELAKVDQTVTGIGNPRGNCLQAAIATVCSLPLAEAPDATDPIVNPELWNIALADWGKRNGWHIASQRELPEQDFCIAIGPTVRENGLHAVVFRRGELYHDPHPSRDGLIRVQYYLALRAIAAEMGDE